MKVNYNYVPSKEQATARLTVGKNRQKSYAAGGKDTFYLKGGTEFELELSNTTNGRVGVKIYLNGECINNNCMIILKPGERGFIDRFINSNDKLKFTTYEVDTAVDGVKEAIKSNGDVNVEFYKESFGNTISWTIPTTGTWTVPNTWTINEPFYGGVYNTGGNTFVGNSGSIQCSSTNMVNMSYSASNVNYCNSTTTFNTCRVNEPVMKETGMVEKGGKSSQEFGTTSFEACYLPFHTVEFKILPESLKPVGINDKNKEYCTGCGFRKRDENWKFCPKCGTKMVN